MNRIRRSRLGFTLVEMMVVLVVISLIATIAVPSVGEAIRSTAKAQSYSLFASMVRAARTTAMRQRQYACVHHQIVDDEIVGNRKLHNRAYLAVMIAGGLKSAESEVAVTDSGVSAGAGWMLIGTAYVANLPLSDGDIPGRLEVTVPLPDGENDDDRYELYVKWPELADGGGAVSPGDMCNAVPVGIGSEIGYVDMTGRAGKWTRVRRFDLSGSTATVSIEPTPTSRGLVVVDAVKIIRVAADTVFTTAMGQTPVRMPGSFVAGELNDTTMTSDGKYRAAGVGASSGAGGDTAVDKEATANFTSFSILFDRNGMMATQVKGGNIIMDSENSFFQPGLGIWDPDAANNVGGGGEPGAVAATVFDYQEFSRQKGGGDASDRIKYLNLNAMMLAPNQQTGQVYRRR